ncbi:MAG: chorismate mutase [Rickettsiales bacterium]
MLVLWQAYATVKKAIATSHLPRTICCTIALAMVENKKTTPEMLDFRRRIDELDDKLIDLLIERIGIIREVGEYKSKNDPGVCPLRAGREAEMILRITEKFKGTDFSESAAAAIWRLLIGASTTVENPLSISAYAPDGQHELYWLAREYFGPFIPASKQAHVNRVIGDVFDGKAAIGIVPQLRRSDSSNWWAGLIQEGKNTPKIFAHIPFAYYGKQPKDAPSGLAIAKLLPEETGNDTSILAIEASGDTSQDKLQKAFANAKLDATWINISTLDSPYRFHLVEVDGFHPSESSTLKNALSSLEDAVRHIHFLGAYAKPITLDN